MMYDLDHKLKLKTRSAYEHLAFKGLLDLTDDKAKSIIADYAKDVVPASEEYVLSVYMQHRVALYAYRSDIPLQCDTGSPYINTAGLRTAIHRLVMERMRNKLDDLINADVD